MYLPENLREYFESQPRCSYRKHVDDIPTYQREETMSEQVSKITTDDDGFWHCSHPQIEDHDLCIFHANAEDRPANLDLGEYFISLITKNFNDSDRNLRQKVKQIIGAELGTLDLNFEKINGSDNLIIDLRCCDAEALHFESAEITNPVDIRGSNITRLNATESNWQQLYAQELTADLIEFDQSNLQRAYFEDTDVKEARFYWTDINYANFHRCDINWGNYMYARLGEVGFFNAEFNVVTFSNATIEGAYFNDASFSYLVYKGVSGRSVHMSGISADAATFEGADLDKISIGGSTEAQLDWAVFDDVELDILKIVNSDTGITSIKSAKIDTLILDEFSFNHIVDLAGTIVRERADIKPADSNYEFGYISHTDAKIMVGDYTVPQQTDIIYDFTDAVVGDINLHSNNGENPLHNVRFYRTDFEGFKFGKLAEVSFDDLRYSIHTLKHSYEEDIQIAMSLNKIALNLHPAFGEEDPLGASGKYNVVDFTFIEENGIENDTHNRALEIAKKQVKSSGREHLQTNLNALETTYLRAKNGASNVGDSVTAGKFFEKERTYRRKRHWEYMVGADTLSTRVHRGSQWVRNGLFAASAGYGERPLRVILFSIGVVGLFTIAYTVTGEPLAGIEDPSILAYLLFSFQSFIAFVVGSPSATNALIVRFLSAFEGFIGAFVVGLFVFVLTRQVHR